MKKMKYLFLSFAALLSFAILLSFAPKSPQTSPQSSIKWLTFNEAMQKSEADGKPVFIDVYTDWCAPCKQMDQKTFTDADVIAFVNKNYHAVKLNPEKGGSFNYQNKEMTANEFMRHFQIIGYPTILVFPKGNKNHFSQVGLINAKEFIAVLEKGLK